MPGRTTNRCRLAAGILVSAGAVTVLATALACQQLPDPVETPIPVDTVTTEIEPNGDFAIATVVTLSSRDAASVTGSIGHRSDVDVYDIGPVRVGDRAAAPLA